MFTNGRRRSNGGAAAPSALDELLAAEREVAAQCDAAEREAESLAAAARTDAEVIERTAAVALEAELAGLDERDRRACAELVRAMEDESARLVTRYRTLADDEVARLASYVVREVTGLRAEARP